MPKPDPVKYEAAKQRLRKRLKKIIAECEQLARDIGWWNENRTDAPPFDNGGDLCAAVLAREVLACVEADKPIPSALWHRMSEQIQANAESRGYGGGIDND